MFDFSLVSPEYKGGYRTGAAYRARSIGTTISGQKQMDDHKTLGEFFGFGLHIYGKCQ